MIFLSRYYAWIFLFLICCLIVAVSTSWADNQVLHAAFNANPTTGNAPLTVAFNAEDSTPGVNASIIKYEWKFEGVTDSWISSGTNPVTNHTYSEAGQYTVYLKITNSRNLSDQTWVSIMVTSPPTPLPSPTTTPTFTPSPTPTFTPSPTPPPTPLPSPTPTPTFTPTPTPIPTFTPRPSPETCLKPELSDIRLSQGKLDPLFDPEIEFYEIDVEYSCDHISVIFINNCPNLEVEAPTNPVPLEVGTNNISIKTKTLNGEPLHYYTLHIRREAPNDTTLMFKDLTIEPNPFSPAWSPDKKDLTEIGGTLNREIPLFIHFFLNAKLMDTIEPREVNRYPGAHVSAALKDRTTWNGFEEKPLPSELYQVEVRTPVLLKQQIGTLLRQPRGIIFNPKAIAFDNEGNLVVASENFPLAVFTPSGEFIRFISKKSSYFALSSTLQGALIGLVENSIYRIDPITLSETLLVNLDELNVVADYQDNLAVSSQGEIYLSCRSQGKILVFTEDGAFTREINIFENQTAGEIHSFTLGPNDHLYVTLLDLVKGIPQGAIKIFSKEGILEKTLLNIYAGGSIPLPNLGAISVLSDGSMVVASAQPLHPLYFSPTKANPYFYYFAKLSPQGELVASFGLPGEFFSIRQITVKNDYLYVADEYGPHRIAVLDQVGNIVSSLSTSPDIFLQPVGMTRLDDSHLVVLDTLLGRCVIFKEDGTIEQVIPLWTLFNSAEEIQAITVSLDGLVYLIGFEDVVVIHRDGTLVKRIPLKKEKMHLRGWGGCIVDKEGKLYLSEKYPGKIWIFSPEGNLMQTIALNSNSDSEKDKNSSWAEQPGFFGPLFCTPDEKLYVQAISLNDQGNLTPAFCELDLQNTKVVNLIYRNREDEENLVIPRSNYSADDDILASFATDGKYFYKAHHDSIMVYDQWGRFLWSFGQEPGWSFSIPALLARDSEVEILEFEGGSHQPGPIRIETWMVNQDVLLAQGEVEIDNIPPVVTVNMDRVVTNSKGQVTLRGNVTDKNFDFYQIFYRRDDDSKHWVAVEKREQFLAEGVLGIFTVPQSDRDCGIEVKVVAWDTAGNSNESTAQLAFDDDSDGLTNAQELALGTDPRQFSRLEVETDLLTLVTPYFFANFEYQLHFYLVDASDPENPRQLPNAHLIVSIDDGTFTQSENTIVWQTPDTDKKTVNITCTLPSGESPNEPNLLEASFEALVMRDNDRDWMPDTREKASSEDDGLTTFLNNPDSDNDGVIDGKDLAPRTTYQEFWNKIYYPGMLGQKIPLCFYGIGGPGSQTIRWFYYCYDDPDEKYIYYNRLGREGIIESDVSSAQKNKELANSMLFPGQKGELNTFMVNPLAQSDILTSSSTNQLDLPTWESIKNNLQTEFDRVIQIQIPNLSNNETQPLQLTTGKTEPTPQPYAITAFEGNALQTNPIEDYLGMYEFTIKKDQEYVDFYYYANTAVANGLVHNVEPINVCTSTDTGIHRGYLVMKIPACDWFADRNVTLQWRIDENADETRLPTHSQDGFKKMGWLIEVFHPDSVVNLSLPLPAISFALTPNSQGRRCILPWDKASYREQVLAQPQGEHLYYTTFKLPGEFLTPGKSFYLKCTPFWVVKSGTKIQFEPLKLPLRRTETISTQNDSLKVLAIIQDPPYQPISVSAVAVETLSPIEHWICRLEPRPDHPLNEEIIKTIRNDLKSSFWPPQANDILRSIPVNGVLYQVRVISTLGMRDTWKKNNRLAPVLLGSLHNNSLDNVDVVCLIASNQHELALLYENVPWGSGNIWLSKGESLAGEGIDLSSTAYNIPEDLSFEQSLNLDSSPENYLDNIKKVNHFVAAGIKIHSSLKKFLDQVSENENILTLTQLEDQTTSSSEQLNTIITQINSSNKIQIQQKTSSVQSISRGILTQTQENTEVLNNNQLKFSSILNRLQNSDKYKSIVAGAKVGTVIITNGIQVYTCASHEDWVGVSAYTLKGTLELSTAILKLTGIASRTRLGAYLPSYLALPEKSFWCEGVALDKVGTKLNLVSLVTGSIEVGYNLYLYSKATDVLSKKEAARNTCAAYIDTGISCIEPLGGLVMGFWVIGSTVVYGVLDKLNVEVSPYIKKVTSTPGQFLTYMVVRLDPNSVPFDKAIDGCTKAQEDAIKKCKNYNKDTKREYIYIFIPPS